MATIFKDIDDLKDSIGGTINSTIQMKSLEPSIELSLQKYLVDWISQEQYNELLDYIIAGGSGSATLDKLLLYVKRPLGYLAVMDYLPIGSVMFGEGGLYRTESETQKGSYKYQANDFLDKTRENGYESLETMLKFLEANENDYPTWQGSDAYQRNKALFMNYASEMKNAYSKYINRYTFETLRPIIEDLECFAILPIIGQAQFDDLKEGLLTKSLTAFEQVLIKLIQKALAYMAVEEGMKQHWVKIDGSNIYTVERLEPQSSEKRGVPSSSAMSTTILHTEEFGNRYVSKMIQYLEDTLTEFPLYEAFKEEQAAEAEAALTAFESLAECTDRPGLLGCGCADTCSCGSSANRGIVNF